MSTTQRTILIALILAATGALGAWGWHLAMEQVWEARVSESEAANRNRMLAATMLLRQDRRQVSVAGSLGELVLDQLPDGTLLLADASGVMEGAKAERLLAWVRRGNTLLAQPRMITPDERSALEEDIHEAEAAEGVRQASAPEDEEDEEEEEEDAAPAPIPDDADTAADSADELVENDPIAARLGVRLFTIPYAPPCDVKHEGRRCRPSADGKHKALVRPLQLPGNAYPIELDAGRSKLIGMPEERQPLWTDADGTTVRAYQEGKGKIVILAADFFDNLALRQHDHGELLLALAALNPGARHVTIVQNLDAPKWYRLLWKHYSMALMAAAALLALLFWAAVRRFGPTLPQPVIERRSLMEHIDASGAWLWKANGGSQVLLDAAREDTLAVIRRRNPALFRQSDTAICAALARLCDLPEDQVFQALYQAAAPTSLHFTRQIRILQELRNHHER
jgi:hypothetical protein